jgi:hypothetical protein
MRITLRRIKVTPIYIYCIVTTFYAFIKMDVMNAGREVGPGWNKPNIVSRGWLS